MSTTSTLDRRASSTTTPAGPAPATPLTHRTAALDGLRTVALAIVVLYHLHVTGSEGGFIGVALGAAVLVALGAAYAVEVPVERLRRRFREARHLLAAERSAVRTSG